MSSDTNSKPNYAETPEELMTPDQMAQMSGLDFIQGIKDGTYPAPPIARTLNYALHDVQHGRVAFRGEPLFSAMNPIGSIHGGWFGTLLDSCMACAVQTTIRKGLGYTTLEYKVNIVRPVFPNGKIFDAIGDVTHSGRRTAVATGQIVDIETGKVFATGSTTCLIFDLT